MCKAHKYFSFLLLFFITSSSPSSISSPDDNPNRDYPTTLHVLRGTELDSLNIIFRQKLGSKYIASLDSFGLIGGAGVWNRGTSTIDNYDRAVSLAKAALVYLKEFSNVMDTSQLSVRFARKNSDLRITDWDISFQTQRINGMEVYGTEIQTVVTDDDVCIDGHFYKDVIIPPNNLISKAKAKNVLVGTEIHFSCWTPGTYVITDSTINTDSMKLCIYPLLKGQRNELRVAWQVPVPSFPVGPMWYYFIDVITGEVIGSRQLFRC